jgi:hypothetical protein
MIGLHLYTLHAAPMACNSNPGIYYRGEEFAAGVYQNSHCRTSAWLGWNRETNTITVGPLHAKAGIIAGGVIGYEIAPVVPLLLPSLAVGSPKSGWFRASWIPTVRGKVTGGLHFSVEYSY